MQELRQKGEGVVYKEETNNSDCKEDRLAREGSDSLGLHGGLDEVRERREEQQRIRGMYVNARHIYNLCYHSLTAMPRIPSASLG